MVDNGRIAALQSNGNMASRVAKALAAKGYPPTISREEIFSYLYPERFPAPYRSPKTKDDRNIRWKITACMNRMPNYEYDGGVYNPRFRRTDHPIPEMS